MYFLDESFLSILSRWKFLSYCLDKSYLRYFYLCFLGLLFWWKLLITSCFLSKEIFNQKVIHYILCQLNFFKQMFEQKFIALHLHESCLCSLLCFLGVLRYLNKACVLFFVQNILIKKIIIINCRDNLNIYTTDLHHRQTRK